MTEKEIVIDLSKKIKFTDALYISIGSFLLSFFVALIQFLIALNTNNWIVTPACWSVLLNFIYAIRMGVPYGVQTEKIISSNTPFENRILIDRIQERLDRIEKKDKKD